MSKSKKRGKKGLFYYEPILIDLPDPPALARSRPRYWKSYAAYAVEQIRMARRRLDLMLREEANEDDLFDIRLQPLQKGIVGTREKYVTIWEATPIAFFLPPDRP